MMNFCGLVEYFVGEWVYDGVNIDLLIRMVIVYGGYMFILEGVVFIFGDKLSYIKDEYGCFLVRMIVVLVWDWNL